MTWALLTGLLFVGLACAGIEHPRRRSPGVCQWPR